MSESLFDKVAGLKPATLLKKETLTQVFSCEFFAKFLRIPFLQNTSGRLNKNHLPHQFVSYEKFKQEEIKYKLVRFAEASSGIT